MANETLCVRETVHHIENKWGGNTIVVDKGQSQVGYFRRVGNDAIQSLEKSASNRLICNDQNFGTCGLQDFDAGEGERRRGRRK